MFSNHVFNILRTWILHSQLHSSSRHEAAIELLGQLEHLGPPLIKRMDASLKLVTAEAYTQSAALGEARQFGCHSLIYFSGLHKPRNDLQFKIGHIGKRTLL